LKFTPRRKALPRANKVPFSMHATIVSLFWGEQENLMSELETTSEGEVEDFTDELSDEALDREGAGFPPACGTAFSSFCGRN
jgi:hypothetical protein